MEIDKEKHFPENPSKENESKNEKDDNPKSDNQNETLKTKNPLPSGPESVEEAKANEAETEKKDGEEVQPTEETETIEQVPNLGKVSEEIDEFICTVSSSSPSKVTYGEEHKSELPKIPDFVEQFAFLVEAKIANYDSHDTPLKWIELSEEDSSSLLEHVDRISKLSKSLSKFSSESEYASTINRIGGILQRSLSYLEEEFKLILEDYKLQNPDHDSEAKQSASESSTVNQTETIETEQAVKEPNFEREAENNIFPGYSDEIVSNLNKLVNALISGGHEMECCHIYFISRRKALEMTMHELGYEKCSIDDMQKKQWESLEREIVTWIKTFKEFSNTILSWESKLADSIFCGHKPISEKLFGRLSRGMVIQLLNFSEAVAMTKHSAEKLFKFLDVYETLRDLVPILDGLLRGEWVHELKSEVSLTRGRLGESMIWIFCELENSIKADTGKTPVPGGAVHPLTRYTMNYLKYACEYKNTLEQVFKEHQKIERADSNRSDFDDSNNAQSHNSDNVPKPSPFQLQLSKVMDLLDTNLDVKSKLYKDTSLSLIFMMNNGRYILQKIKGSTEIKSLLGDSWIRKRSSDLRSYHKNYQRETWGRLLQCLSSDGLNVNGKVVKPVLKEKFKSFNTMFDEIHKTQSTWIVSDEQLQSELRVSISAVVIPAYRSFMARFSSTFTPGRQTEKYIKYQPEDIETYIDELFDGHAAASGSGKKR